MIHMEFPVEDQFLVLLSKRLLEEHGCKMSALPHIFHSFLIDLVFTRSLYMGIVHGQNNCITQ